MSVQRAAGTGSQKAYRLGLLPSLSRLLQRIQASEIDIFKESSSVRFAYKVPQVGFATKVTGLRSFEAKPNRNFRKLRRPQPSWRRRRRTR